jgi:nucleotide-binding universal stress UspA family protein
MSTYNIKKILVPVDFSKTSSKATEFAVRIATKTKSELILIHVTSDLYPTAEPDYFGPAPSLPYVDFLKEYVEQSDDHLSKLSEQIMLQNNLQVKTETGKGKVETEILDAAKNHKVDLIVMGTHGVSGMREFFIGSHSFRVIRDAKCPVLTIPQKTRVKLFKNILMSFRDKPHSREKVNFAIDMGKIFGATIHVLGIDTEFTAAHKKKIKLEAEQIKKLIEKNGLASSTKIISHSYAGETVLNYASDINADLIISMSDLDKMDITEYFTGPFAQQIVNHSTIPVLSIRPKFNTDTIDLRFY